MFFNVTVDVIAVIALYIALQYRHVLIYLFLVKRSGFYSKSTIW